MREHKYRAWDKVNNVMCEVFSIQFIDILNPDSKIPGLEHLQPTIPKGITVIHIGTDSQNGHRYFLEDNDSDYFNLLEYTGLKDKNGVEIYEGDILAVGKLLVLGQVMFRPTDGFWATKDNHNFYRIDGDNVYIIGNIYENPELLEDETPLT